MLVCYDTHAAMTISEADGLKALVACRLPHPAQ
jgi:hypothetical protein